MKTTTSHRVTFDHLHLLTARTGPVDHRATALVDTDDGIRIVAPGLVLTPGSGIRRLLTTRTDLVEDARVAGLTVSEFMRDNAGRIAAELNAGLREAHDA
jgi:hypothetical protein